MHIHLCITSQQTLANLIPVYQQKPDKLILLTTDFMQEAANKIVSAIEDYQDCHTQTEIVSAMPDSGLAEIIAFGQTFIDNLRSQNPDATIHLNATGGKKLMALGLIEAMRAKLDNIYYLDTAEQKIEYLPIKGHLTPPVPMQSVLTVAQYLKAQGYRVERRQCADDNYLAAIHHRAEVTHQLAKHAYAFDRANLITTLNTQIQRSTLHKQSSKYQVKLDFNLHYLSQGLLKQWFKVFELGLQAGLFKWQRDKLLLQFDSPEIAAYLGGGWLEEYVYLCAKGLKLYDVNLNVEVIGAAESKNEFDVLITHQNRILIIECKTVNLKASSTHKNKHKRIKANEIAYKFDSLSDDIKGIYGDRWLVSSGTAGIMKDRAKQLGFSIITAQGLADFDQRLKKWAGSL